jgi:hypothetical protein
MHKREWKASVHLEAEGSRTDGWPLASFANCVALKVSTLEMENRSSARSRLAKVASNPRARSTTTCKTSLSLAITHVHVAAVCVRCNLLAAKFNAARPHNISLADTKNVRASRVTHLANEERKMSTSRTKNLTSQTTKWLGNFFSRMFKLKILLVEQ